MATDTDTDTVVESTRSAADARRMTADALTFIARKLVDHPDAVDVQSMDGDKVDTVLELRVHAEDMGKVIGKRGRTAKAIRTVIKAAATREGTSATVEIVD